MSQETSEWLKSNILVGFTNERLPWWADGTEDTLYPEDVPLVEVEKRLFGFQQTEDILYLKRKNEAGKYAYVPVVGHKAVSDPMDNSGTVLGIHGEDYQIHTFQSSLIDPVVTVLSESDIRIGSAGLLKDRKVGWLQIERPENVVVGGGVSFRPHILLSTSLDGSMRTQINNSVTNTVCDNTMAVARGEGLAYAAKHTADSLSKLADMAGVVASLMATQDTFTAEVEALLAEEVSPVRFGKFLEAHVPILEDESKQAVTRSEKKREALTQMYKTDLRVAPWAGTAWGIVQMVNTFEQHMSQLRGVPRVEKNMLRAIKGEWAEIDGQTLKTLASV